MMSPLIKFARPKRRIVELEDEGSFARAIQDAEAIKRNARGRGDPRQTVEVVIVVSNDKKTWRDAEVTYSGAWRSSLDGGLPQPTIDDLIDIGRKWGARYVKSIVRSTI